jgi:diadenosine tetraphosphate (Ap4A) HIT family hydrolase
VQLQSSQKEGILMSDDWKKDRFGAIERNENPMVLTRMKSGYAVIGDTQFLPGYCVLLAYPKVNSLEDLSLAAKTDFLRDMSLLGEAVQSVCNPRRMNYSIYGNSDEFLHAHVFPRYDWEPEERKPYPIWKYPREMWVMPAVQYCDEKHLSLRQQITEKLIALIAKDYNFD